MSECHTVASLSLFTVTQDRTISGSNDWLRLDQGGTAMFATISRSISTHGRAITNDWRISMARAIVGNCATSGSDQRPPYDQSLRPATDGTTNRPLPPATDHIRAIVQTLVASCDRAYDQSWKTDGTINRGCNDRSHDQS